MSVAFRDASSHELDAASLTQVLDLCLSCWPDGEFADDDLDHALGGRHFLAEMDGRIVGHASVVPRVLEADGQPLRTGYVEAVATLARHRRRGIATRLLVAAGAHIADAYEMGALSTDLPSLYERLGWRRWEGETWVRELDGSLTRTPEEDAGLLTLATPRTPPMTRHEAISCAWRPGDCW